jgi:glyoxylase-like metal-dependent hydrolase (beta-lactamase superfamily II)
MTGADSRMQGTPRTAPERVSALAWRVLAPNAGPMTLDGTNSYLIQAPGRDGVVVVDPGPVDEAHLAVLAARPVELVLLTHRHRDHSAARHRLVELTGAPVRAFDPLQCVGARAIADGEELTAAGVLIRVLHTPGHTADSVCFQLPEDGPTGSVLTGDTILGRGTTMLDFPDGTLGAYLDSLDALARLGPATVLPAHGPMLPDLAAACSSYREHRLHRLEHVRDALERLGPDATASAVADVVYAGTDPAVRFAAEASIRAQLAYLSEQHSRGEEQHLDG